jgi:hypothetical protein
LLILASSKKSRNHGGQQERGPPRKLKATTKNWKKLSLKHDLVTLPGYSLGNSIKGTDADALEIYETIVSAVTEINLIKRLAQNAHLFLIESAAKDKVLHLLHPSTHGSTKGNGGRQYFYQLLSIIRNGKLRSDASPLAIFKKYLKELEPFFLDKIGKYF